MNGNLHRDWKRIRKARGYEDEQGIAEELREVFVQMAPLPQDMGEELALRFLSEPVDDEVLYRTEEVLEVLDGQWTAQDSALRDDDWAYLRDLVDSWATELDMDVVTSVMRVVVERGGFSLNE
ncbi:MAG: hypothetical protein MI717_11330 [Spirochaetales bacterium]|nr:hypothetical protein [Spirochaetales bacterium]